MIVIASAGPDATGMINRDVLEALGPDGILVNVSAAASSMSRRWSKPSKSGKLGRRRPGRVCR